MNMHTPEQIYEIVLKVLQELNKTDVSKLSTEEKLKLARNPNATVEILQSLAQVVDAGVRYWVARHPNATVEILQGLAQDENSGVRYWGCEPEPDPSVKIVDKDHWWYNMI